MRITRNNKVAKSKKQKKMKRLFNFLKFLGFEVEIKEKYGDEKELSLTNFKFLPLNWLVVFLAIYLSGAILFDSWFILDKTQKGSVEYFGKFIKEVGPGGLYLKVPFISKVRKVETEVRYRIELGFRTVEKTDPAEYKDVLEEAVMLTKGGHLSSVFWIIQYTINDTYNWLYKVKDPEKVLNMLGQGSMRLIIGKTFIDDILTTEKAEIQEKNKKLLQNYCNGIGLDITINEVKLQDCGLPNQEVQSAYDGVMNAIKKKEQMTNEAMGYINQTIPKAEGQASSIINKANSYYSQQVNDAEGEVARFMGLYEEYRKDPKTTKQKLWFEAMQEVMPKAKKTIVGNKNMLNLKNF